MPRKISFSIPVPINLSGSSSSNASAKSKSIRRTEYDDETLKWLNDNKRQSNERRDIAADRLIAAKPGGEVLLAQLGLTDVSDHLLAHAADAAQIELAGNNLSEIPRRMLAFRKLQRLDLSANKFRTLPSELGRLTSLRKLNVFHNELSDLPETIGDLTKLESFNAGDNAIEYLPNTIGNLTNLKKLSLSGNLLIDLPKEIKACKNLEKVDLSRNHFEKLPDELGSLVNLRILLASDNALADNVAETGEATHRAIPESVGRLPKLKEFDVTGNPLTFLPTTFNALEYASERKMKIKRFGNRSLAWSELNIRIGNTPLPVELAKEGRLPELETVPQVQYKPLYQPPHLSEEPVPHEEANLEPPLDAFEENSISRMARAMPELLAAQTALGGNGQGVLGELLRSLAANGMLGGTGQPLMPPVHPPMDQSRYSGGPAQPGGAMPFVARGGEGVVPGAAPGPSYGPPAGYPQTVQHNAGFSANPAFAQPPATHLPFAQPYMAPAPLSQPAFAQPPAASFGGMFQPAPGQAVQSPMLAELFQRLSVMPAAPQRPHAYAAPLHTPGLRKTLFDYSAPSYSSDEQYSLDMIGLHQLHNATLTGLAEMFRERIYLQGAELEQRVQEAKMLGNPKRDLWTLCSMMFRQHVICDLAGKVANTNAAKKAANPGKLDLPEDPLQIAMMYQVLVCRPNELQILGFDDLRRHLDENPTFQSMCRNIVPPEQHDFFRINIMNDVKRAETQDNRRLVKEFAARQPFWQQFLSEHKSATNAMWISSNHRRF